MVAGYESEKDRKKRLEREEAQRRAEDEQRSRQLQALLPDAAARLRRTPPTVMLEIPHTTLVRERLVYKTKPGWYLGSTTTSDPLRDPFTTYTTHYAISQDGELYRGRPAPERAAFQVVVSPGKPCPPPGSPAEAAQFRELLDKAGRPPT